MINNIKTIIKVIHIYSIREKAVIIMKHAIDAMNSERPHIDVDDILNVIDSPDNTVHESGNRFKATKWMKKRTIIVYYDEFEDEIYVHGVSATRRRVV